MRKLRMTVYMALAFAVVAAAIGYPIYAGLTGSGPCRLMADWQLATFGEYSRIGNILLLALPLFGLAITWVSVSGRILVPDVRRESLAARRSHPMGRNSGQSGRRSFLLRLMARPWVLLAVSIVLIAGGIALGNAMAARSQADVTAQAIDLGKAERPTTDYVRVAGIAHTELARTLETEHFWGTSTATYVPITTVGWRHDQPLVYFLRIESKHEYLDTTRPRALPLALDGPPAPVTLVAADGGSRLPYRIADAFDEAHLTLADHTVILDLALHPGADWFREAAWLAALMGYLLFFVALLGFAAAGQLPDGAQAAGETAR